MVRPGQAFFSDATRRLETPQSKDDRRRRRQRDGQTNNNSRVHYTFHNVVTLRRSRLFRRDSPSSTRVLSASSSPKLFWWCVVVVVVWPSGEYSVHLRGTATKSTQTTNCILRNSFGAATAITTTVDDLWGPPVPQVKSSPVKTDLAVAPCDQTITI